MDHDHSGVYLIITHPDDPYREAAVLPAAFEKVLADGEKTYRELGWEPVRFQDGCAYTTRARPPEQREAREERVDEKREAREETEAPEAKAKR